ncbi:unnamed protein product [Mytilus edulis]|uniref:Hemicentin-1-like n=1 Tax=Mytilus edulis TaxID=6550 RepID=A0A8S3QYY7_MYTED|nr:unnamed protein product [Mytilus edulis]
MWNPLCCPSKSKYANKSLLVSRAQQAVMYPLTPAYADLHQQLTFMCKISVRNDWRIHLTEILLSNTTITSDVTRETSIECKVTSRPAASITLIKVNSEGTVQDISSSSTETVTSSITGEIVTSILNFRFTAKDNGGLIYCHADNSISTINSSFVTLRIYYPPSDDPTIQQTPNRPIISGEKVVLTCSVSGGFPLPVLSWNCSGNNTNNTSGKTAFYTILFMALKQDNGKTCTCSAAHPVAEYRPQMHITLNVYFPPDKLPVLMQIPEGPVYTSSSVLLVCSVNGGNPVATLTWNCTGVIKINSSETTAISSIEIPVTNLNHGMACSCLASHIIDTYKHTAHHLLDVIFPPDVYPTVRQATPGPIDTGTAVTLICSVPGGNPLATLTWDCQGITSNTSTETEAVLEIEFTVDKNYNGRICSCSATHPIVTYRPTSQISLVVYFSPSKPNLVLKPEMPWFVGNITEIECVSEPGNPESIFEWTSDNMAVDVNMSALIIGPLTKYNNGKVIICTVQNEYTKRRGSILKSNVVHINVEYFPEISIDTLPLFVNEGDNVSITCNAFGNPVPIVTWFQQDQNITERQINQSILHLFDVGRLLNEELYTCKAFATSTTYGSLVAENTTELIVFYPPVITNFQVLNGPTVSENEDVTFRCEAESNPLSNITWLFLNDQTKLKEENSVYTSTYTITNSNCFHTGTYQCQAANYRNGVISVYAKDVALNVMCSPRLDTRYQSLPKIVAVEENGDLELSAHIIAYPLPVIRWIFTNEVNSTSVLHGNLFVKVNVVPKGKPLPPSKVIVVCTSTSVAMFWNSEFDGGARQTFMVKYWRTLDGTTISSALVENLTEQTVIKELLPDSNYSFIVQATNKHGTSNSTIKTCKTGAKGKSPASEQRQAYQIILCLSIYDEPEPEIILKSVQGTHYIDASSSELKNKTQRNLDETNTEKRSVYTKQEVPTDHSTVQSTSRTDSEHIFDTNSYEEMSTETKVTTPIEKPPRAHLSDNNTQLYESMKAHACQNTSKSDQGREMKDTKPRDNKFQLYESMKTPVKENTSKLDQSSKRKIKDEKSKDNSTQLYESMKTPPQGEII